MIRVRNLVAIAAMTALAACGGGTASSAGGDARPRSAGDLPAPNTYRDAASTRPAARDHDDTLSGQDAADLIALFGQPRLDRRDGTARVMQFGSDSCLLDVYLYPPRSGAEPVVTHVDARAAGTGTDTDVRACVAQLRRR